MPTTDYKFGRIWVNVSDESLWMQTVFPDGARLPATPEPLDKYAELAARLGYGNRGKPFDIWRCCFEHETYHTIAAQIFGMDASPTLWRAAREVSALPPLPTDPNDAQCGVEESLILNLQAYFNGAARPIVDVKHLSEAAGVPVGTLRREFIDRIRAARKDAVTWQRIHPAPTSG